MAEAAISINGRMYHLSCGEGEEARLYELSEMVRRKIDALVAEYGQVGDDRLLLMSALLIADDVLDARTRLDALEKMIARLQDKAIPSGMEGG
jgi:cell division protein ZapA